MKVLLRNVGKRGPRVVYDINHKPVTVHPGGDAEANLSEHMVKRLQSFDGALTVQVLEGAQPAPTKAKGAGTPAPAKTPRNTLIPADWEKLDWPKLRSLASKVGTGPINNRAQAEKAIEAALASGA